MPLELGCIKGALAGELFPAEFLGRHAGRDDRLAKLVFGLVPILVGAKPVVRTERKLDFVGEVEVFVDAGRELAKGARLLDDLILTAEDVRVVLRELADAHQPMERAMRLVAVAAAVLVEADRQLLVAGCALLYTQ